MLGFVLSQIPSNAISNLELRRSYDALQRYLVLPSAATLSNIYRTEYSLTMNAIQKQLPLRNIVSLVLDSWTSMNKLAIMLVIAYYVDQN